MVPFSSGVGINGLKPVTKGGAWFAPEEYCEINPEYGFDMEEQADAESSYKIYASITRIEKLN